VGRPTLEPKLCELILTMARDNPQDFVIEHLGVAHRILTDDAPQQVVGRQ
jgi:hypothetical protein